MPAAGNFSCATGDCESGRIDCPNRAYSWAPVTYAYFRLDNGGFDSYTVSVEYGYNLPVVVVRSQKGNGTCMSAGCALDNLNMTCPQDLKIFQEDKLVACDSSCKRYDTPETCSTRDYRSKETCKWATYTTNFETACPRAYAYAYHEHVTTFTCPSSTDYVITFCPSFFPNNNTISNNRISMPPAPLTDKKHDSQRTLKIILGVLVALAVVIIIVLLLVIVRGKSTIRNSHGNKDNIEAAVMLKRYSYANAEKMTNSFDHVLGKGGYGTVYKGKLPDVSGRDIALKILKESKGNGEEFINELASMSIKFSIG